MRPKDCLLLYRYYCRYYLEMSQDAGSPSEAAVALSSSPAAVDKLETKKSLLGLVEAIGESIVSFTPDFSLSDTWEETLSAFDSARAAATIVLADEPNIDKSQIRQVKSCLDKVLICLKAYQHSFHMMSAERIALGVFGAEISKLEASSKRPNLGRGCHGSNGGRDGEYHGGNRCLFQDQVRRTVTSVACFVYSLIERDDTVLGVEVQHQTLYTSATTTPVVQHYSITVVYNK